MPAERTAKAKPKTCSTLPWLCPTKYCNNCKNERFGRHCELKTFYNKLDIHDRAPYRRGSSGVDVEVAETRTSAEIASKAITKQLEKEQEGDPKPVKRKTQEQLHGKQHGCRTGSAGLTSPSPAPRPATSEMSPATEHTIKSNPNLPWKKAKVRLAGCS